MQKMHYIQLEIENITPLFIAGADKYHIMNEGLRPPSLRGILRWWFRVVLAGFTTNIDEIYKLESNIFGNTEMKSSISIISINEKTNTEKLSEIKKEINKYEKFTITAKHGGKTNISYKYKKYNLNTKSHKNQDPLRYLWFSLLPSKNAPKNQIREDFKIGSRYKIIVRSASLEYLLIISNLLWLMIFLGGIGSRSRRGGGNFKVISFKTSFDAKKIRANKIQNSDFENFQLPNFIIRSTDSKNSSSIIAFLNKNLALVLNNLKNYYLKSSNNPEEITIDNHIKGVPILKKGFCDIVLITEDKNKNILKKFSNIFEALRYIGEKYKNYRLNLKSSEELDKQNNVILKQEFRRYALGLPIIIKFSNMRNKNKKQKPAKLKINGRFLPINKLRHASPIIFGLLPLEDGYVIRVVKFYSSLNYEFLNYSKEARKTIEGFDDKINEIKVDLPEV